MDFYIIAAIIQKSMGKRIKTVSCPSLRRAVQGAAAAKPGEAHRRLYMYIRRGPRKFWPDCREI